MSFFLKNVYLAICLISTYKSTSKRPKITSETLFLYKDPEVEKKKWLGLDSPNPPEQSRAGADTMREGTPSETV